MDHQLESFAYLAIEVLEWLRAAKLLGAAEALRQASGSIRVELEEDKFNKAMSILGEKLDEYAFKERLELVSLMKIENAVEFARDGRSLDHKLAH